MNKSQANKLWRCMPAMTAVFATVALHAVLLYAATAWRSQPAPAAPEYETGGFVMIGAGGDRQTDLETALLSLLETARPDFLARPDQDYGFSSRLRLETATPPVSLPLTDPERDFAIPMAGENPAPPLPSAQPVAPLASGLMPWPILDPPVADHPPAGRVPQNAVLWRFADGTRLEAPPALDAQAVETLLERTPANAVTMIEISRAAGLTRIRLRAGSGNRELDELLLQALARQLRYQESRSRESETLYELFPAEGAAKLVQADFRLVERRQPKAGEGAP